MARRVQLVVGRLLDPAGLALDRARHRVDDLGRRRPHHVLARLVVPVWKSKFYGAFFLNRRVVLDAIDASPARWRGNAGSLLLDRARTAAPSPRNDLVHPTHWLISTQRRT